MKRSATTPAPARGGGRRTRSVKQYDTTRARSIEELDPNSSYAKAYALIPPGSRVLDLGCGSGELASYLTARGDRVWGADINPGAIARAAAHCVATRVADLEITPLADLFPGRRFDAIVYADVLEHVRDPWDLLQQSRPLLVDGGVVVASIPNFAHAAVRLAVVSGSIPYRQLGILDDTHVRFFTGKSVAALFEESGFRVQAIERTKLAFGAPSDLVPDVGVLRVPPTIEQHVRNDPEGETLQFVVRAVMLPGEWNMAALRTRLHNVEAKLEEQAIGLRNFGRELADALALAERNAEAARAAEARTAQIQGRANELEARVSGLETRRRELEAQGADLETRRAAEAAGRNEALAALAQARGDYAAALEAGRHADEIIARTRAELLDVQEQRDEARAAVHQGLNRVRGLEEELRREAAVSRSALEESQRRLAELRDQTQVLAALRSAHAAALVRGEQLEAARANEAALANALRHLKDALMSAIEERHQRAAEARDAQQRLVRQERAAAEAHAALRAEADALAAELHAANARAEGARVRLRREALARLAREHAAAAPTTDDGAQFWRNGAASG